ncbi:sulfite exporter TauE/SafE family protein [Emticicia sp. BO119]|uniref:sulfite exporter TauE/SafE family protein n=1 Tax=Emticicia sp. BO119 TaxID=2757768 RepID=UPI0015F0E766|nr:sulfite exporter TauE/SafE family protein [Emticicia sp. BO119]MBA4850890.1 sulfite exporter TauE/SafE family protein [Emticicia sp. BO119]
MNVTELLGFMSSVLIGISLGLVGGGGSLLTLPVLVYLLGINPLLSTTYSLFVVGATSLVGSLTYMRKKQVNYTIAFVFVIPSFMGVYFTRQYLLSVINKPFFLIADYEIPKNVAIMVFFGILMVAASYSMIKNKVQSVEKSHSDAPHFLLITISGFIIGIITGLVGAGGGFLIIPTLVLIARLPMKMAVGTSLLIIAVKSLIGFTSDLSGLSIDWTFLSAFTILSVTGIFVGSYLSQFVENQKLKQTFGWLVLVMGVYIISKELISSFV